METTSAAERAAFGSGFFSEFSASLFAESIFAHLNSAAGWCKLGGFRIFRDPTILSTYFPVHLCIGVDAAGTVARDVTMTKRERMGVFET